jgi:hypothetical protein
LLDYLLFGQLRHGFFLVVILLSIFFFWQDSLDLVLLTLCLKLLLASLLVGQVGLLFLELDLLVDNLFLAWFFAVVMTARVFFLVPAMAAWTRFGHQSDYI